MLRLAATIARVAASDATVLIRGETGTGKELVAHAVHELSRRHDGPFVALNCAALSTSLLESELFGHEKGAFTGASHERIGHFELADGGTLLLDDIAQFPVALQPKLLRAIQEREIIPIGGHERTKIDTRLVTTTNVDLQEEMIAGRFRDDLYYRLCVVEVVVPPLRDRPGDIALLARHFLQMYVCRHGTEPRRLTQEAVAVLYDYNWPGNVRELQNTIERAVLLSTSTDIRPQDLPMYEHAGPDLMGPIRVSIGSTWREAEQTVLIRTYEACGRNKTTTARMLGLSLRTIRKKLNSYEEADCGAKDTSIR